MVGEGEFEVGEVEVEAAEDDADGGVEGGAVGDGDVVGWGDGAVEGRVGAADVGDGFGVEFGFDAGFAQDEDGAFVGGEGQNARDVDCGGVGGAEDFVLVGREEGGISEVDCGRGLGRGWGRDAYDAGGDAHCGELFVVVGAGFGAVVCYEDDLFAWVEGELCGHAEKGEVGA